MTNSEIHRWARPLYIGLQSTPAGRSEIAGLMVWKTNSISRRKSSMYEKLWEEIAQFWLKTYEQNRRWVRTRKTVFITGKQRRCLSVYCSADIIVVSPTSLSLTSNGVSVSCASPKVNFFYSLIAPLCWVALAISLRWLSHQDHSNSRVNDFVRCRQDKLNL